MNGVQTDFMKKKETKISKSLIIPVYYNEQNLPDLLSAMETLADQQGPQFEVVFVIDGSPDNSYAYLAKALPDLPYPSQLITHSRNFGVFTAVRTGMEYALGKNIAVMAADLQEPLSLINDFFQELESDKADVIFGIRMGRKDPPLTTFLSNTYWRLYRKFIEPDIPNGGVDTFACNSAVKEAVLAIQEPNSSLISQLFWVGFRRSFIPYTRLKRQIGTSAWSIKKRMRYMLDSIFSYSDLPIIMVLWIGVLGCITTFTIGIISLLGKLFGWISVPGYTTLILIILFVGSLLLLSQGIIGCYLWRAFENTKKRPLSLVNNKITNFDNQPEL